MREMRVMPLTVARTLRRFMLFFVVRPLQRPTAPMPQLQVRPVAGSRSSGGL
jgi:hypothetical protein